MSPGPQQFKDPIVQSRVHRERDEFIASISEEKICELASSWRNDDPCQFFREPKRGSYNICYFVQFDDLEQWVVRVPLVPCLAFGATYKLESEIATMQLVSERTTIPIPRIIALSISDSPEPLSSYLILEYVHGEKLSIAQVDELPDEQRTRLCTSLADIHIQLRRLEFSSIGCLTRGRDGIQVRKKTTSIDLNMQEVQGHQPSKIQASYGGRDGTLSSANKYAEMLLKIADNAFMKDRSDELDEEDAADRLYHLHIFRQYAMDWVDPRLDRGPFVLVHGDLEPYNLIVNKDMEIICLLDWEWSRVVPLQFFKPPLWLGRYPETTVMAYNFAYTDYLEKFDQLLDIVRSREQARSGDVRLAEEWTEAKEDAGFLVANALENWTDIDWFANRYINRKRYGSKSDLEDRVKAFMEEDPARKELVARKMLEARTRGTVVDGLKDSEVPSGASIDGDAESAAPKPEGIGRGFCQLWKGFASFAPIVLRPAHAQALGIVAVLAGTSYFLAIHNHRLLWRR